MRCFNRLDSGCCNFFVDNRCVPSCPSPLVPNSRFDCGKSLSIKVCIYMYTHSRHMYILCSSTVPHCSGISGRSFITHRCSCTGEEERKPGTHCSRMHQIPLVTRILLHYTKITVNFCLPPERSHCMVILLHVGHMHAVLKSKTMSF